MIQGNALELDQRPAMFRAIVAPPGCAKDANAAVLFLFRPHRQQQRS